MKQITLNLMHSKDNWPHLAESYLHIQNEEIEDYLITLRLSAQGLEVRRISRTLGGEEVRPVITNLQFLDMLRPPTVQQQLLKKLGFIEANLLLEAAETYQDSAGKHIEPIQRILSLRRNQNIRKRGDVGPLGTPHL